MSENYAKVRVRRIVIAYPFVVALIAVALNQFVFGVAPLVIALPDSLIFGAMAVALVLLTINHGWLMTSTELVRLKFDLRATPEEWRESELDPAAAAPEGLLELQRRHNAHRNTSENMVYFGPLALLFLWASPPLAAGLAWMIGFGCARVGYTYGYLSGRTGVRGAFMTLSLLCMFGLASYLVLALLRLDFGL
jgi:uncharacterized MAPEG superfamily protein